MVKLMLILGVGLTQSARRKPTKNRKPNPHSSTGSCSGEDTCENKLKRLVLGVA